MKSQLKYALFPIIATLGFVSAAAVLEQVGSECDWLRRDPKIWGTYGDWAAAILPASMILVTVKMWLEDRTQAALQELASITSDVSLTIRAGGQVWLRNESSSKITALEVSSPTASLTLPAEVRAISGELHVSNSSVVSVKYATQSGAQVTISLGS